jgi:hypothetical protein
MSAKELPSPELLRQLLRYDPDTGKLYWRERSNPENNNAVNTFNKVWAGREAFTAVTASGYHHGSVNNVHYYAHRIIFAMSYGLSNFKELDHISGDKSDNRLVNLREVSHRQNMRNQRISSANLSGTIGVGYESGIKKWRASIYVNRKRICLGRFDSIDDAITVRKKAEAKYGFHPNHGRR